MDVLNDSPTRRPASKVQVLEGRIFEVGEDYLILGTGRSQMRLGGRAPHPAGRRARLRTVVSCRTGRMFPPTSAAPPPAWTRSSRGLTLPTCPSSSPPS